LASLSCRKGKKKGQKRYIFVSEPVEKKARKKRETIGIPFHRKKKRKKNHRLLMGQSVKGHKREG